MYNLFSGISHLRDRNRLGQSTILIIMALFVFVIGLSGCKQPLSSTKGQTTSIQTTIVQTTLSSLSSQQTTASPTTSGGQTTVTTTSQQTTTTSQADNKTRFSQADLIINGIQVEATPQEAEKALGLPKESKTEKDMVTGLDVLTYSYDGLRLIFKKDSETDTSFQLKYVDVTGRDYALARGLRVGVTAQNAIQLFFSEKNEIEYQGYTVLYGDPDQLDREEEKGEIAFAYFNDQEARFLHMTPPYMSEHATIYDEMAAFTLTIENKIVTKVSWMLGAGAE